jgi:hypothetical protein
MDTRQRRAARAKRSEDSLMSDDASEARKRIDAMRNRIQAQGSIMGRPGTPKLPFNSMDPLGALFNDVLAALDDLEKRVAELEAKEKSEP